MMLLSVKAIQRILYNAVSREVLILTCTSDMAKEIKREIKCYVRNLMSRDIRIYDNSDGLNFGAYQYIYIMDVDKWNRESRRPFSGLIISTKSGMQVEHVAGGNDVKLLPITEV